MPDFFDRYINLVGEESVSRSLSLSSTLFEEIADRMKALGDTVYAPGKWTVKDILQHCIDTERILAYRALAFARNEKAELPGFDEETYASHTLARERTLDDLLEEFEVVRTATIWLFENFSDQMLFREGVANGRRISVLALGFTIVGHAIHHVRILEERYFPLLSQAV
jgi:hypothetical protein